MSCGLATKEERPDAEGLERGATTGMGKAVTGAARAEATGMAEGLEAVEASTLAPGSAGSSPAMWVERREEE